MIIKHVFILAFFIMSTLNIISVYRLKNYHTSVANYIRVLAVSVLVPVVSTLTIVGVYVDWIIEIAYSVFFASIDVVLAAFVSFLYIYTEEVKYKKRHQVLFISIIAIDVTSILSNIFFHHAFTITVTEFKDAHYYIVENQFFPFTIHLIICYILSALCLWLIVKK